MIGIVDYGMGNLRSVQKGLEAVGAESHIVRSSDEVDRCRKLVLPGVGAFADAMANLRSAELVEPVRKFIASGRPFLGICLGLQLLFDVGHEDGDYEGLCVLRGHVAPFELSDKSLKIPHMGWNGIHQTRTGNPLFEGVEEASQVYFVHGYYANPADEAVVGSTTEYGGAFCSSIWQYNVFATQFHPEKSQWVGQKMLANFARM